MRGMNLLHLVKKKPDETKEATGLSAASPEETVGREWETVELPKNYVRGRLALQILIAVPLLVLAVLGVKATFADAPAVATGSNGPATIATDTSAASSTAEYVARNWIALDDPANRTARLSRVWADAENPNWNGAGTLDLKGSTYTVATHVIDEQTVDVTVAVYIARGEEAVGWIGVLVPIQLIDGAASVRAEPKIVGLPDPEPAPVPTPDNTDSDLSTQTRTDVDRFFTAWSDGDAFGVTAPGVEIPAPPPSFGTATVTSWDVLAGTGDTRHGIAQVRFEIGDETTITTTYEVEITRVTASGGNERWQVATIS